MALQMQEKGKKAINYPYIARSQAGYYYLFIKPNQAVGLYDGAVMTGMKEKNYTLVHEITLSYAECSN